MAISPQLKPRVTVSTDSDYELPPRTSADGEAWRDRSGRNSGSSMGYILGVIILIAAGYFAYSYYSPVTVTPTVTNQSSTPVTPPASLEPPAAVPAVPATPPASTTTP